MTIRLAAAATIAGVLAGCGSGGQTQEEQDRQAEEHAKSFGVDAQVSTNADDTKSIAIDRSMGGMAAPAGSNLDVPEGFPDDIPIYPQINIVAASQGQTSDGLDQVAGFYEARMTAAGWTSESTQQQGPSMRVLLFKKGQRTAGVSLISGQGTTVQLTTMVMP